MQKDGGFAAAGLPKPLLFGWPIDTSALSTGPARGLSDNDRPLSLSPYSSRPRSHILQLTLPNANSQSEAAPVENIGLFKSVKFLTSDLKVTVNCLYYLFTFLNWPAASSEFVYIPSTLKLNLIVYKNDNYPVLMVQFSLVMAVCSSRGLLRAGMGETISVELSTTCSYIYVYGVFRPCVVLMNLLIRFWQEMVSSAIHIFTRFSL